MKPLRVLLLVLFVFSINGGAGSEVVAQSWSKKTLAKPGFWGSGTIDSAGNPHFVFSRPRPMLGQNWAELAHMWFDGKKWRSEVLDSYRDLFYAAIAFDHSGRVHVMYGKGVQTGNSVLRHAIRDNGSWSSTDVEGGGWSPSLLVAQDGTLHVFHSNFGEIRHGVLGASGWQMETLGSSSAGYITGKISAGLIDGTTPVVAWADYKITHVAWLSPSGWSRLPDLQGGYGRIAVGQNGTIHAVYKGLSNSYPELYYSVFDGASWVTQTLVDKSTAFGGSPGDEYSFSSHRAAIAVDAEGRPHITFELQASAGNAHGCVVGYGFLNDDLWYGSRLLKSSWCDDTEQNLYLDPKGIPHIIASLSNADYFTGLRYFQLNGTSLGVSINFKNRGSVTSDIPGIDCGTDCRDRYFPGKAVTLTANPMPGFRFLRWSGACAGTDPLCTVTLDRNRTVRAIFGKAN